MRRFNPEKELRKIQYGGRNRILYGIIAFLLIVAIGSTYALYQVRYSKRIIYTKVAPFSSKDIELAVNIKGEGSIDYFPSQEELTKKGMRYTGTECEKDDITTVTWDNNEGILDLKTKGPNKCTVSFGSTYTVKAIVESHGTVSPATQEVTPNGTSETFTVMPEEGYGVESITCSNDQKVEQTGDTFKVTNVTSDTKCNIKVSKKYIITAHVEANGGVSPDKQYVVPNQDSDEFIVTLDPGYEVRSITCTNSQLVSRPTGNTFYLTNATNNSECTVTITKIQTLFDYCSSGSTLSSCITKSLAAYNLEEDDSTNKNIRYIGAYPNNYIWFNCDDYSLVTDAETAASQNCEKWRIIGYMNDKSRVKIIRAESVGNMVWDKTGATSGSNNWNRPADLRTKLIDYYNGTAISDYYNGRSTKGITSVTKGMIDQVTWNLGGRSTTSATVQTFYTAERGSTGGYAAPTQTTWTGYIGLMYPSDYGYAADKTCWGTKVGSYNNGCQENDWLYTSTSQWTLTPNSSNSDKHVFYVRSNGYVDSDYVYSTRAVRPSLYLKSSVKIKSGVGNGSEEEPYVLIP